MGAEAIDYRISKVVVLCKDCGNDVGLYPARHKCQQVDRPAMPTLPAQYTKRNNAPGSIELSSRSISSGSSSSMTSSPSLSSNDNSPSTPSNKWSPFSFKNSSSPTNENEESVYFNNFAANLPETNDSSTGKKLWGKVLQNEKWKQLSEKNDKQKPTGKIWGKFLQATQTMADKIPSRDDRGAESDEDHWEGETHVSRVLREYYEKKRLPLPDWLFDDNSPIQRKKSTRINNQENSLDVSNSNSPMRTPSRRRLWEQSDDTKKMSNRERELQELRQSPKDSKYNDRSYRDEQYDEDRHRYKNDRNQRQRDDYSDDYYKDRYRNRDDKRSDHYRSRDDERSDRYRSRDDERNDRYRNRNEDYSDRYRNREEDNTSRYRNREDHNDRYSHDKYSQHRNDEDRYHQRKNDDSYRNNYAREEKYNHERERSRQNRAYDEDNYRPQSPPITSQQRVNSINRRKVFEDTKEEDIRPPPRSERRTRGFDETKYSRSNRHEEKSGGNDLDNQYHEIKGNIRQIPLPSKERTARYDTPDLMKREPSVRSNGHRYITTNNYF